MRAGWQTAVRGRLVCGVQRWAASSREAQAPDAAAVAPPWRNMVPPLHAPPACTAQGTPLPRLPQHRGALRGASAPLSIPALVKELGIEGLASLQALVPSLVEELAAEGERHATPQQLVAGRLCAACDQRTMRACCAYFSEPPCTPQTVAHPRLLVTQVPPSLPSPRLGVGQAGCGRRLLGARRLRGGPAGRRARLLPAERIHRLRHGACL